MANKTLFGNSSNTTTNNTTLSGVPVVDSVNAAGGIAYARSAEEALAQFAVTGTFNDTFYTSGADQLDEVKKLAHTVDPEFLAQLAVYSRTSAYMKDTSAFLLAVLLTRSPDLFKVVFNRVVDNGKMLKNFVQIIRSGQVGRKSFGTMPRRMIRQFLENRSYEQLMDDNIGNEPSLADVVKMVHPRGKDAQAEAFFGWVISSEKVNKNNLPEIVKNFEIFKAASADERTVPNRLNWQYLSNCNLSTKEWEHVATHNMGWQALRMNLNTLARNKVFENSAVTKQIASKLSDEVAIERSKVFPYQLYVATKMSQGAVPSEIESALETAMEYSTKNVPNFNGKKVLVGVDCSGSMSAPVTGARGTATTKVNCNQVGSLIAACLVRNNKGAKVARFDTKAQEVSVLETDTIVAATTKIGANGGGTDCGASLSLWNNKGYKADVVFVISDNESWSTSYGNHTSTMREWDKFKKNNPEAKLVLIDLAASGNTQAKTNGKDVLNIAGWSDSYFSVVSSFLEGEAANTWVSQIKESVKLS